MRSLLILSVLLSAVMFPAAHATSSFGYADNGLMIQFVGRDFSPEFQGVIELSGKTGPHAIPRETYKLTDYVYLKSLRLEFTNPGDDSLPPSFILTVSGQSATVEAGGQTFVGHFSWES